MLLEEPAGMLSALASIVSRADSMGVGGREKPRVQPLSSMIGAVTWGMHPHIVAPAAPSFQFFHMLSSGILGMRTAYKVLKQCAPA